jgi:protoporphyrinogen oxidase
MARIACYGNFSTDMLPDPGKDALSVEYFTFAHEDLWQMTDEQLIALASKEMEQVGLLDAGDVESAFVLRERDAYPVYYLGYRNNLDVIRSHLARFGNLTPIGRGGMYRYNNQDHAILSGLLAARNFCVPGSRHDLWEINEENEYLEEKQLPLPVHAGSAGATP